MNKGIKILTAVSVVGAAMGTVACGAEEQGAGGPSTVGARIVGESREVAQGLHVESPRSGWGSPKRKAWQLKKRIQKCRAARRSSLQILHSSDNESSFVDPNTLEPKVLNYAALVSGLQSLAAQECIPSLHLTAGDHTIPGPFYQASAAVDALGEPGLADIAIYNAMALDANGMGNHEFDGGIDEFSHLLQAADYPFLSVNLDFSQVQLSHDTPEIEVGRDASSCRINAGKVVKSCWLRVGGERIGLIGRAPADFFNVISDPQNTLPGLDFVGGRDPATNQPLVSAVEQVLSQVDKLERRGVQRIILLDHAQDFTGDPLSATSLRGIDIIVAAGSTGFMAQPEANGPFNLLREGDEPGASYPTVREDSEGETVLVVNSDQLNAYVGQLIVTFDDAGHIESIDERSGPIATTEVAVALLAEEIGQEELEAPLAVQAIFDWIVSTDSIQDAFSVIGTTDYPLIGARIDVRGRETNLARVVADSTLWGATVFATQNPELGIGGIDVALKNGGGIRDSIVGPNIIRLTVQAALAFDNQLAIVELSGDGLLAAMENAVSRVPAADGRYPQLAGMELEFDPSAPPLEGLASVIEPSRVQTLVVTRATGEVDVLVEGGTVQGDLSRTFVMATNDFLTSGGDGYAALAAAPKLGTSAIGEQEILENYIIDELMGLVSIEDPPSAPRVTRTATP